MQYIIYQNQNYDQPKKKLLQLIHCLTNIHCQDITLTTKTEFK